MEEANSIRCKYIRFLSMLDKDFLSELPAALAELCMHMLYLLSWLS